PTPALPDVPGLGAVLRHESLGLRPRCFRDVGRPPGRCAPCGGFARLPRCPTCRAWALYFDTNRSAFGLAAFVMSGGRLVAAVPAAASPDSRVARRAGLGRCTSTRIARPSASLLS